MKSWELTLKGKFTDSLLWLILRRLGFGLTIITVCLLGVALFFGAIALLIVIGTKHPYALVGLALLIIAYLIGHYEIS